MTNKEIEIWLADRRLARIGLKLTLPTNKRSHEWHAVDKVEVIKKAIDRLNRARQLED